MTNNFKSGDVVQLKSGGPKMTVTMAKNDSTKNPTVWCTWFEGKLHKNGNFPPAALKYA
jgi:uncharacterized protein YodC (DUF2158 family)